MTQNAIELIEQAIELASSAQDEHKRDTGLASGYTSSLLSLLSSLKQDLTCPECKGSGVWSWPSSTADPNPTEKTCYACNGEGDLVSYLEKQIADLQSRLEKAEAENKAKDSESQRMIMCEWCGLSMRYSINDRELVSQAVKYHSVICSANPLVQQIADLQSSLKAKDEVIRKIDLLLDCMVKHWGENSSLNSKLYADCGMARQEIAVLAIPGKEK